MDREALAKVVLETSRCCADGYRRGTEGDKEVAEKCAIAASNTGYFILAAMGFTHAEVMKMNETQK